ncbi:MAG: patatin-like phospholipase family protein [Clostridia bacterium]|nr:patatin-like phospholipase family protein [Clostridia bacterium]
MAQRIFFYEEWIAKAGTRLVFGVLFSGMGVYAATQLGVLRALEESNLPPTALAGVGTGAWIAGLYACKPDAGEVYAAMREACALGRRLLDPDRYSTLGKLQGLIRGGRLVGLLEKQTAGRSLGELDLALAIPTLALPTRKTLVFASRCPPEDGEAVWTQQAPVSLAIQAAMSIPALMRPALWMGVPLVGVAGLGEGMAALRQLRVKHALCVDASCQLPRGRLNVWDIAALCGPHYQPSDCPSGWYMLAPRVPETVHASALEALDICVEVGYNAALEAIPRIKAQMGGGLGKVLAFPKK